MIDDHVYSSRSLIPFDINRDHVRSHRSFANILSVNILVIWWYEIPDMSSDVRVIMPFISTMHATSHILVDEERHEAYPHCSLPILGPLRSFQRTPLHAVCTGSR